MPKLHIPALKEGITLAEDWKFDLHIETRNTSLIALVLGREPTGTEMWGRFNPSSRAYEGKLDGPFRFSLPAGTELIVDRIYIRQGAKDFDSVTFRVKSSPDERTKKARFWVTLDDANKIEMTS